MSTKTKTLSVQATIREDFGLSEIESRFVWEKHVAIKKGRDNPNAAALWERAGGRAKTPESGATSASLALKKANVKEALDWLAKRREAKARKSRAGQLRRLEGHANADIADYVSVSEVFPERAELMALFETVKDDEVLFRELRRRLSSVRLTDWENLTKEQRRSIQSVEEDKDGRPKFKLEPKAWAEKILQEAHGWSKQDEILEDIASGVDDGVAMLMQFIRAKDPALADSVKELIDEAREQAANGSD